MIGRREFLGFGAVLPLLVGSDPATLKIKRVEAYVLKIGARRDIVCARIETAEGIHGWGEGTTPPNVQPVAAQIRSFEKLLQGQSAWEIEKLWRRMYILEENTLGGTLFAAMSAIDIALWDIVGKKLNVACVQAAGRQDSRPAANLHQLPLGRDSAHGRCLQEAHAGVDRAG